MLPPRVRILPVAIAASEPGTWQISSVVKGEGAASGKPPTGPPYELREEREPWEGDAARKYPSRPQLRTTTPPRLPGPPVPRSFADSLLSEAAVPWPSLGPALASSGTTGSRPRGQTQLTQTCCCSGSYYCLRRGENPTARSTRGPGPVPSRSSFSAPFAAAAAASRPVAGWGRGTQT